MRRIIALASALTLVAAVPHHVLTADYWMGYSGTKNVPAQEAARRLSWVSTDNHGSALIAPLGVKTLMYTNPNRVQPGDPLWSPDEDVYAHTCGGTRARGESQYPKLVLTDPHSRKLADNFRRSIDAHAEGGHFDAVFVDEAVGTAYAGDQPCNYSFDDWLRGEGQLYKSTRYPIIYNALNDFSDRGPAKEMALNKYAAGGMMEECYAQIAPDHRVAGWQWYTTEVTELRMAQQRKLFFCYGRDLTPAEQAYDGRMYTYASFLLTYDPNTTVLWEYYKTASGGHVMPESGLVALDPVKRVDRVGQLRGNEGVYMREYRKCYIDGRPAGACVAAVNPDEDAHHLPLGKYHRTLELSGSGVFDGGTIRIANRRPPDTLEPRGAVIAFR